MKAISAILGALVFLLLLAAIGSAGIAMGWFDNAGDASIWPWPVFVGLALICAVLSVVAFRQSKKSAANPSTRDDT